MLFLHFTFSLSSLTDRDVCLQKHLQNKTKTKKRKQSITETDNRKRWLRGYSHKISLTFTNWDTEPGFEDLHTLEAVLDMLGFQRVSQPSGRELRWREKEDTFTHCR